MARSKRLPSMSLVVALSATVAGCDSDPGSQVAQRDVYSGPNAFENCVADWGNEELCKQRLNDEERKAAGSSSGGGGGGSHVMIWGPGYYGGERTVSHGGNTYTPQTTRAERTAAFNSQFKPTSFNAPRPATSVSSRGGFGATGRSFGGGSSS